MLTKEHFSILLNRSQAQKEVKTRTFFLSHFDKILEPYLHVPLWEDSTSSSEIKRVREQAYANRGVRTVRKRGRGRSLNRLEEAIPLGVLGVWVSL